MSGTLARQTAKPSGTGGGRRRSLPRKILRLTAYSCTVSLATAILAARFGYGQIERSTIHLGEELIRLTESERTGRHYKFRLNGELLNIASKTTNLPFEGILDQFQRACAERADDIPEELARLGEASAPGASQSALRAPGVGVFREERDGRGVVLCFAQGGPTDYVSVFRRLSEFAETGDLGKLGDLRYIMARRTQPGSHVVAVWTDGPLPLRAMFPDDADAPGTDAVSAARPYGTRRILSATVEEAPYGVHLYESVTPPSVIVEHYDREMLRLGWEANHRVASGVPYARAFSRHGVDLFVTAEWSGEKSLLSIVEMRPR
ncbi:hypothetical protein ACMHYB_44020 [Sorangium sp. So ce1128]